MESDTEDTTRSGRFELDDNEQPQQPDLHGPLKNSPRDETYRKAMFLQEVHKCGWDAELKSVHYGSFHSNPAALIIIECRFSPSPDIRFENATVTIAFDRKTSANARDNRTPRDIPEVVDLFPWDVYGKVTEVKHTVTDTLTVGVNTPNTPAGNANAAFGHEHQNEFATGPRKQIHGGKSSNQKLSRPYNVAKWDVSQNSSENDGISRRFLCAIVVRHDGKKFSAEVTMKVQGTSKRSTINVVSKGKAVLVSAWPWPKNDPINFDPKIVPSDLSVLNLTKPLDQLTEDDYRSLTPLQDEYKVGESL
jgi:hypothetical protein